MSAQSKYTPERVATLCRVVSRTGCNKRACEAAGVTQWTFYAWLRTKPQFRERVARAREAYYAIDEDAIVAEFHRRLLEALDGPVQTYTAHETIVFPNGETAHKTIRTTVKRGPAEWAVRIVAPQVLGKYGVRRSEVGP